MVVVVVAVFAGGAVWATTRWPSSEVVATTTPSTTRVLPTTSTTSTTVESTTTVASSGVPWATTLVLAPTSSGDLTGDHVYLDPGHNGRNYAFSSSINQLVPAGAGLKACDTTGTATDAGYPEHAFAWRMALLVSASLRARGATVILSRANDDGVGPCVNVRGTLGATVRADVALSIHADGGPPNGRGFAVLEPAGIGPSAAVTNESRALGDALASALATSGMPASSYDGVNGVAVRRDLAGLNLSTVPKVLLECGNMRNNTDAALLSSASWQASAASILANALAAWLLSHAAS